MKTSLHPPLPPSLSDKWGETPPLRVKTYTVAALLVYWGFTETPESGCAYVKKLVRSGTLRNVMKPGLDWRFDTTEVLALWHEMQN